ncbi:MAG: ComF family protein, partial [Candidatus Geothermincolia bacterium]
MTRPLLRDHFTDLLYPSLCAGCGKAFVTALCPDCFARLSGECRAEDLRLRDMRGPVAFEGLRAAGDYSGILKDMVLALKSSERRMAGPLASLMAVAAGNDPAYLHPWAVCFVPSTRDRIAERGFNPARALAARLSSTCGAPLVDALRVARAVEDQDRTPGALRWGNVKGAFALSDATRVRGDLL